MNPLRLYDYIQLSRSRVLDAVRSLTPEQYDRRFDFGLTTIGATLTHIMISEWYYIERLEGREVPPYERWPIRYDEPPPFDVVDATWAEQATRVRSVIEGERDWSRSVRWDSFPDEQGRRYHIDTTPDELFTQLVLHEVHHRSQLMSMLRLLGDAAPKVQDVDFNALMFRRTEMTA